MSLPTSVTFYLFTMPPKYPLLLRENPLLSWSIFTFPIPLPYFPVLTKLISAIK
ncbi:hypothetical protein ACTXT7_017525, partial [Hymenolepis weldensis]